MFSIDLAPAHPPLMGGSQMGHAYRLIGSGVRVIVPMDGVFSTRPSVRQRDLLETLRHGIRVITSCAIRPAALSLPVSALMEAIELYHADRTG